MSGPLEWLASERRELWDFLTACCHKHRTTTVGCTTCGEIFKAFEATIAAHIEREIREAYDEGYEAGEKPHLPSILDAINFRQEQYGWNDTKMAAMLDMQKSHFSEFKSGKRSLPINSIRIAYAIGIPADVLLSDQLTQESEKES